MGYQEALKAAGAAIHVFKAFGSYQGSWFAKVTYQDKTGWVVGSYGSCSGCDAFQSEFGYHCEHEHGENTYYNPVDEGFIDDCEQCQLTKELLIDFGKHYLDNMITQEEAEEEAAEDLDWDMEAQEMVDFIKNHKDFLDLQAIFEYKLMKN